jgi:hypothetical protein
MDEAPPDNRYMKSVVYWYVVLTVIVSEEVDLDSPDVKVCFASLMTLVGFAHIQLSARN